MKYFFIVLSSFFFSTSVFAQAVVMNPGKAIGQLVVLSEEDVLSETPKYKALSPLSIPIFAELPLDLSVVAGVITIKQQNLLSHVQIKSRARKTPNLDISQLEGGFSNELFAGFKEGDYIEFELALPNSIKITASTEQAANAFYKEKLNQKIELQSDLTVQSILTMDQLSWQNYNIVGSKAANYAELAKALNTPERTVVRPSFAVPFFYYNQFVEQNPKVKAEIQKVIKDPLMRRVTASVYREEKLKALTDLILSSETIVDRALVDSLLAIFETQIDAEGRKRNMKLRSSTNSEDLPNFNGAGLYTSASYKPNKKKKEKSLEDKVASLEEALKIVWASIWNVRAFDERNYFSIPHDQVYMGIQINPSFSDELADGVVVTKNIAGVPLLQGAGVYIEAQRGGVHSVANPEAGVKPVKILVQYDANEPLNMQKYVVHILQMSNVADDMETILPQDNPNPVMSDDEAKDLVFQSLKAVDHFRPLLGDQNPDHFSLDIEFKVDKTDTNARQVYLKQSRPYID